MSQFFEKEDFQKPNRNPWYKKPVYWVSMIIVIAIDIFLLCYDWNSDRQTESTQTEDVASILTSISEPQDTACTVDADEDAEGSTIVTEPVSNLSKQDSQVVSSEEVDELAISVIRGNYGNNPERRERLKERYQEVQNKVNEMYRNGQVR